MQGIYQIRNIQNDKIYVGSSIDIEYRIETHIRELRKNHHNNTYLQNAWNKYGEENFVFEIVELVDDVAQLRDIENWYIKNWKCTTHKFGYNILSDTNIGLGVKASKEVRKKISEACKGAKNGNYGRKHTKEEIQRIRDNRWGKDYVCKPKKSSYIRKTPEELAESRRLFSEKCKGRKLSEETKQKLSKLATGRKASEELKRRFSEQRRGSKNSNSKLTRQQVLEIYEKMNSGINYKEVCKEYGVGQCWVYKIKRKEHWVFNDT